MSVTFIADFIFSLRLVSKKNQKRNICQALLRNQVELWKIESETGQKVKDCKGVTAVGSVNCSIIKKEYHCMFLISLKHGFLYQNILNN